MLALLLATVLAADGAAPDGVAADDQNTRFASYMNGVELTGHFTVTGSEKELSPKSETYTIRKVEKLPQENLWRFTARIKYGETDVELPMDLPVLWAGNTPVITLDNVWLPGMGTFSARVVIHDGLYSGTWRHDEKGGHLFGTIRKLPVTEESPQSEQSPAPSGENSGTKPQTP